MLTLISWASLGIAFICAIVIAVDEIRQPQKMWIMNVVWPVTALYFSVFVLWGYSRIGRGMARNAMQGMSMDQMEPQMTGHEERAGYDPTWRQIAVSDTHCGAGCVIGDVISEFSLLSVKQGIIAAIKSDTLSILTFEIGLFGWMALTFFVFFPHPHLRPTQAGYWFMMQIGMILGFFTSYPMNRWLIKAGWKEAMG